MIILYLIIASIVTPIILEFVNRYAFKSQLTNVPAWLLTSAVCLAVAITVCALPGGWPMQIQWILVLAAFLYYGANSIFTLVIKYWRTGRA